MILPPDELLNELKGRYAEPQRHYHSWAYIGALLRHYETVREQLVDPAAVLWALYWHDAIYDPTAPDNEAKSADLFAKQAQSHLECESLTLGETIIRATERHEIPAGLSAIQTQDLSTFLDLDLSILAAPRASFDTCEAQIRAEYAFVPEDAYRIGRAALLRRFLERERLYFTDHFFELWEDAARDNLRYSLNALAKEG